MITSPSEPVKYLLSNDQDMAWGIVVTTVGHQDIPSGASYPSAEHPDRYIFSTARGRILNEYQLVYISRGSGVFTSSSLKETKIEAGMFFLLFPGEWHTYRPDPATGWHESWIGFSGENIDNRVAAGFFLPSQPLFPVGIQEDILQLFKKALKVSQEQRAGYQQMLGGLVNLLLGLAYSGNRQSAFEDPQVVNRINRARIIMQENIRDQITGEDIARQVGMGYSRFRHIFKEYTGFSPARYRLELRIREAKELLLNTTLSSQEIAYLTGFESPSYFNRAFKKLVRQTPNQYRAD